MPNKPINEIYSDFLLRKVKFHRKIEWDIFRDALMFYMDQKFVSSASLTSTLFEMIFTTRLVRETANPDSFIATKDNVQQQMMNLVNREDEVINQEKLNFREITKALKEIGVISADEKNDYDAAYTNLRNPVAHGLTFRLSESLLNKRPTNPFDVDMNYELVYKKASELLINKIYEIMTIKGLRKE